MSKTKKTSKRRQKQIKRRRIRIKHTLIAQKKLNEKSGPQPLTSESQNISQNQQLGGKKEMDQEQTYTEKQFECENNFKNHEDVSFSEELYEITKTEDKNEPKLDSKTTDFNYSIKAIADQNEPMKIIPPKKDTSLTTKQINSKVESPKRLLLDDGTISSDEVNDIENKLNLDNILNPLSSSNEINVGNVRTLPRFSNFNNNPSSFSELNMLDNQNDSKSEDINFENIASIMNNQDDGYNPNNGIGEYLGESNINNLSVNSLLNSQTFISISNILNDYSTNDSSNIASELDAAINLLPNPKTILQQSMGTDMTTNYSNNYSN